MIKIASKRIVEGVIIDTGEIVTKVHERQKFLPCPKITVTLRNATNNTSRIKNYNLWGEIWVEDNAFNRGLLKGH